MKTLYLNHFLAQMLLPVLDLANINSCFVEPLDCLKHGSKDEQGTHFNIIEQTDNSITFGYSPMAGEAHEPKYTYAIIADEQHAVGLTIQDDKGVSHIIAHTGSLIPEKNEELYKYLTILVCKVVTSWQDLLKRVYQGQNEFYLRVGFGGRSSKNIVFVDDELESADAPPLDAELSVFNEIDDSEYILTKDMPNDNILLGVEAQAFFAY